MPCRNSSPLHFNSQPHEEADEPAVLCQDLVFCISTHSLTKRLTERMRLLGVWEDISTHSLTKRLTASREHFSQVSPPDISTHSLTKRLTANGCRNCPDGRDFNSQPHEEADYMMWSARPQKLTFQLTASRRG